MDFLVQLEDQSVVNVEIQRIGYVFPGQRSACYSADLLLREYRQVRRKTTKETFSYRKISNVYTIVLFEKSTSEFHQFPEQYLHRFQQKSNTGMRLNLLQYGQIYELCQNIEQVMGMFSKELYELDRNTVQYMIDELQKENKRWKEKDRCNQEEKRYLKEEIEQLRKEMNQMKKQAELRGV